VPHITETRLSACAILSSDAGSLHTSAKTNARAMTIDSRAESRGKNKFVGERCTKLVLQDPNQVASNRDFPSYANARVEMNYAFFLVEIAPLQ
jgi:hypothetical protein